MHCGWSKYMLLFVVLANSYLPSLQKSKPSCHDYEKFALLSFKQRFIIDCHASFSDIAYPKVNSWHDFRSSDCCRWDGVQCDEKIGHVIGLDLSSSCLYGNFPSNSTLFSLNHLRELDLSDNNFNYSQIPSAIGHLHQLTHLNLYSSVFSGEIPSEISTLSSLNVLDLSYIRDPSGFNQQLNLKLHDLSLEKLVYNLTSLTQLILSRVDISSTVPLILSNRTSLEKILLDDCNLFGEFPAVIFQLPNLETVSLFNNVKLGGYLPEFHFHSPLRFLIVDGTTFSGRLPASLGNLGSLSMLSLQGCNFSGQVPYSLGNLTNLTYLSLAHNHFSGDLPCSIMNLTRLGMLGLSDMMNVGLGKLNSWLPKLNSTLTQLVLSQLNLGNEILPALSSFSSLNMLDLSHNQLTSQLPPWFMNLTKLTDLDLSFNQLQGPIPPWISHLINLFEISLSFRGSVGMFDSFLNLPNLRALHLSGVSLTFPPNLNSSNSSNLLKFDDLRLESCNLTEFPKFLRQQDELRSMSLSGNNIAGAIPQWFVNITRDSMLYLDLSNNILTGFEQPVVFLPWNNLEILYFNDNKLRGHLPSPSPLQVYQVSHNQFYGVIPKHICQSTSLVGLDLSNNNLSGQIPSCLGHQLGVSLQVLNLRGNKLGGTIPETFSRSCQLSMINLSQNQFEGKLPKSLVNCKMLEVIDVGRNHINDTFPSWLGSLPELQVLVLRHNNFHGIITAPLPAGRDFSSLRIIDLSYNFHTGNLPSRYFRSWGAMTVSNENQSNSSNSLFRVTLAMDNGGFLFEDERYDYGITIMNKGSETFYTRILTVFRVVDFSSNKFTGRIPELIGDLRGVQALNLSNNNLVGGIPSSLVNMTDLESLDLSHNMLSGEIPQDLTKLTSLEIFNVSHNRLVGPIPEGEQFNTFDNSSFDGNIALCGAQVSKQCGRVDSLPPSAQGTNEETEKDSKLVDWIIRSLGCASGFIVGYVVGKVFITDKHHDWFIETFGRRGRSKIRARTSTPSRRN